MRSIITFELVTLTRRKPSGGAQSEGHHHGNNALPTFDEADF